MRIPASTNRQHLARATRDVHEALHVHPLLSRMVAPQLPMQTYLACLEAQFAFYDCVETTRQTHGHWDKFNLAAARDALRADIGTPRLKPLSKLPPHSHGQVLGALYVAHGAQFGRAQMRANIAKVLPTAPNEFFGTRSDPLLWRELTNALEESSDLPALMEGARVAFRLMQTAADMALAHFASELAELSLQDEH